MALVFTVRLLVSSLIRNCIVCKYSTLFDLCDNSSQLFIIQIDFLEMHVNKKMLNLQRIGCMMNTFEQMLILLNVLLCGYHMRHVTSRH